MTRPAVCLPPRSTLTNLDGSWRAAVKEPPVTTAVLEAAESIRLVQAQPERARLLALAALARADADADHRAASMAERALGLVAKERNEIVGAVGHLRAAVRRAERAGDRRLAAEGQMSLALVLVHGGKTAGALRQAELAATGLRGSDAARMHMQRALILQQLGRVDEALEGYRRALQSFRRSGDRLREARLLCNRGVLHAYRGSLTAAQADLLKAERLSVDLGQDLLTAGIYQNLGFVAARRGDVPAALGWYDRAEERYLDQGVERPELLLDRAELLLSVRLLAEARSGAERAVNEFARGQVGFGTAEARLVVAQVALLQGDLLAAGEAAVRARRAFTRQHRSGWAALARYVALRVRWTSGDHGPGTLRSALRSAQELADTGWAIPALDARVLAAQVALEQGRLTVAQRELALASKARHRGPVELRARAWHAHALAYLAHGDRQQADSALRAGLQVLDDHRAALGATELRAHVSALGADLALCGLRLAVNEGDADAFLDWAERWRASALLERPVRPSDDTALAAALAELRLTIMKLDQAALNGHETTGLLRRQTVLEEAIRRRSRQAPGRGGGAPRSDVSPSTASLSAALGDQALVELAALDGQLHVVVVAGGRSRIHHLGPVATVLSELEMLRFSLRRLARGPRVPAAVDAAARGVRHGAQRLDDLLLAPLTADLGERPLVIAPTGSLYAVPWSLLASCQGRAVTVTPCAALWQRPPTPPRSTNRAGTAVVLVAGPGLPHAADEIRSLSRRYPDAQCLIGEAATVGAVARAIDGADLAHVAAHGTFRADNPLFSCLHLVDGPLTVYDLESLARAPATMVLAACESGLSSVEAGDELLGLASALFALGTRALVASVAAVPDDQTRRLMLDLHDGLHAGEAPSIALARAQIRPADQDDSTSLVAAAAFVCFGAGDIGLRATG